MLQGLTLPARYGISTIFHLSTDCAALQQHQSNPKLQNQRVTVLNSIHIHTPSHQRCSSENNIPQLTLSSCSFGSAHTHWRPGGRTLPIIASWCSVLLPRVDGDSNFSPSIHPPHQPSSNTRRSPNKRMLEVFGSPPALPPLLIITTSRTLLNTHAISTSLMSRDSSASRIWAPGKA